MRPWIIITLVVAIAAPASAERMGYFEEFIGWSADRTFYVVSTSGTDGMFMPAVCLSKLGVASPTWPKKIPVPEKDSQCTERLDMLLPDENLDAEAWAKRAAAWVVATKPSAKGPKGETVTVKRASGEIVEVAVSRKGKRIARGYLELKYASFPVPDTTATYWRSDGGAVAITAGYPPAGDDNPGFGPPSFLVVLPLDGSVADTAVPKSKRQEAQALNTEGMKLLGAKKLDDAQKQFKLATDADDTYMLAYYNLACTASLRKDKPASLEALRTLAGSDDKDAKSYLKKGLTDHDLDWIGEDPDGAKILKRKPKK